MAAFCYIWEYHVAAEHRPAFEAAYAPDGTWVALFRKASGYLRTELLHDPAEPARCLTIDYWESRADYQAFRERFRAEFEAIDTACELLTQSEALVGHFELGRRSQA